MVLALATGRNNDGTGGPSPRVVHGKGLLITHQGGYCLFRVWLGLFWLSLQNCVAFPGCPRRPAAGNHDPSWETGNAEPTRLPTQGKRLP